MTLPEHLLKAALLGTAKQPFASESVLSDASALSLGDETPEAQLLLSVVTLKLDQRAGYIAGHNPLPLPDACVPETTSVCSERAMRPLRLMIKGIHTFALKEWLITTIKARHHVQADVIPNLLLLGLNRKELRPYLLPVLGQRGLWLSLEILNQNWKWVFDTPDYPIDDVIAFEQLHEQEVLTQLREKPLNQLLPQVNSWFKNRLVWSDELVEALLHNMETVQPRSNGGWWFNNFVSQLTSYSYFFPLHQHKEIKRRLEASPKFNSGTAYITEGLQVIYDFRRHMIEAIQAREE
jgi:hypothetical protein